MQRRNLIVGSIAGALSAAFKTHAASLLPIFIQEARSHHLRNLHIGTAMPVSDNGGDTWVAAWADDDKLYSPSNDTTGFHKMPDSNLLFNRIDGSDPLHLSGTTVNPMQEYGKGGQEGPDGCTWKSSGCTSIDGVLYWVVARHKYGEKSGDPNRRQTAQNASIIKSTDLGRTWTRPADVNYKAPMFPGRRFATPYFIEFGHEGSSRANVGDYVYAVSNNGFWDCGDDMVLGRVARSKIGFLNGSDWEFYTGGNGRHRHSWTKDMDRAKPVLEKAGRLGMTGAVYLHARQRYLMIGWYYPAGGGKMKGAGTHTVWDFYDAPRPWGPWTRIGSHDTQPSGYYSPEICPKFQTSNRVFIFTAGFWESRPDYRLHVVPIEFE